MDYIDAYVAAVPKINKAAYLEHARMIAGVFKEYGALGVAECWGDDVPEGKLTSFPMAVKCSPDETVVFGWVSWPSKAVRVKGMAAAMADPRFKSGHPMPFDGKRMIFGGFEKTLEL